jgi:hypothetical protein
VQQVLQVLGLVLQVPGQVLVLVLQVLGLQGLGLQGLGLGGGLLRSSLSTHPQNFIFANPQKLRSLKINIY